jgi:hypothetical protein
MNQPHNDLRINVRPEDYRMGDGNINLKGMPLFPSGNSLLDFFFFERQMLNYGDTDGCVIFTGQEIIGNMWEAWTQEGTISAQTNAWADSLGFMVLGTDGKKHFRCSERWLQIKTGNGLNGNSIQDVFDAAKKYGLIPESMLPVDPTLTPAEYIDPSVITQEMINVGQQFLAGVGGKTFLMYQWANDGTADPSKRIAALPYGPLAIGVNVGSDWNEVNPPAPLSGQNPGHCVALFDETITNGTDTASIFDHYLPNPKYLINWDIRYALQVFLTITPPPLPPPAPVPTPATPTSPAQPVTVPQLKAWLLALSSWLSNILETITPTGRDRLQGASRSPKWSGVEKAYRKLHPTCEVCGTKGTLTNPLNVHHIAPFHLHPELELSVDNLWTMCRQHHFLFGHFMNWKSFNKTVIDDSALWKTRIENRTE